MLCQNCRVHLATTHIQTIHNAQSTTLHLCSECASKLGANQFLDGFGFNSFLGNLLAAQSPPEVHAGTLIRCESCGSTLQDILQSGQVGCSDCYSRFYQELLPSLQRLHGKTEHAGKLPEAAKAEVQREHAIAALRIQLGKAVAEQDFETAAQLRDQILALERQVQSLE